MKPGILGAVAALAAMAGVNSRPLSQNTIARRRELTAAWRWYEPRKLILPKIGPRPASTYRAARRNAHRKFAGGAR
jgi:hypothetical protein